MGSLVNMRQIYRSLTTIMFLGMFYTQYYEKVFSETLQETISVFNQTNFIFYVNPFTRSLSPL